MAKYKEAAAIVALTAVAVTGCGAANHAPQTYKSIQPPKGESLPGNSPRDLECSTRKLGSILLTNSDQTQLLAGQSPAVVEKLRTPVQANAIQVQVPEVGNNSSYYRDKSMAYQIAQTLGIDQRLFGGQEGIAMMDKDANVPAGEIDISTFVISCKPLQSPEGQPSSGSGHEI